MAKVSFKSKTENEIPEQSGSTTGTDAQPRQPLPSGTDAQPRPLAAQSEQALGQPLGGDFYGDWDREDVRLPRINLIHKTSDGEMIEKFGIGSFAFNKEVKLSDGKTPVIVTALRAAKDYVQKLPFSSQATPAICKTVEEVRAKGGSFNYDDYTGKDDSPFFQPRAHIELITALPDASKGDEAAESLFPYEFNGTKYGRAILTVSSSAYTSVAKELATLTNHNQIMRKGLRFGRLELTSETRKKADLDWKIPVIKFVGENSADLVAFFEGLH